MSKDATNAKTAGGRSRTVKGSNIKLFDLAKEPYSRSGAAAKAADPRSDRLAARVSSAAAVAAQDLLNRPPFEPEVDDEGLGSEAFQHPDSDDDHAQQDEAGRHSPSPPPHTSPVVEALSEMVRMQQQSISDLREVSRSAQKQLQVAAQSSGSSAGQNPDSIPDISDEAAARIGALMDRLRDTEHQLAAAISREPVSPRPPLHPPSPRRLSFGGRKAKPAFSSERSDLMATSGPLDRVLTRYPSAQSAQEAALASHAAARDAARAAHAAALAAHVEHQQSAHGPKPTRASRNSAPDFGRYDAEELEAVRNGKWMKPEPLSPEHYSGKPLTRDGYEKDKFVASDDDSVLFSSIDSTDDNTCTTASSAKDSTESASENERRLEIIAEAIRRSARKCAPGEDAIRLSAAGKKLAELRAIDIRIKRRTPRSHVIDLILNMWLRGQLSNIQADHVSEFLRQLNLLQPEYAISVFYALVKRIKPLSTTLFKFVYRCIAGYLPDLKKCFARACRSVSAKSKKAAKPLKSAKPTVRAPTIRDIADIEYAVGTFTNDYRAYERDHKGVQHKSMFQCLNPHQASSLAAMAMQSEDIIDSMTNEQFLEMWKETFGFKSSAAVLQALSRVRFAGDYLEPSSWAEHFRLFSLKLSQAPSAHQPPSEEVSKMFVNACSRPLLSKDVLAHKPDTLPAALALVLARLNDNGFMR